MTKAWSGVLAVAALSCLGALAGHSTCNAAATASLVVMQTNPNGVPTLGTQYLLGIQVGGIATPTFLGSNLINFTGALKNTTTTAPGTFYTATKVLFQTESNTATSGDASYARKNDSYFASPWSTLLTSPSGAGETSTSLFIDGGVYGALPSYVPSNGTYPFAYVDVTSSTGVSITGTLAIGTTPAPIGYGNGLLLGLDGSLLALNPPGGDYDRSGVVDGGDYAVWRKRSGQTYTLAGEKPGATTPGVVDAEDYTYWRSRYGATSGSGSGSGLGSSAVPEPASVSLLIIGFTIAGRRLVRRKTRTNTEGQIASV